MSDTYYDDTEEAPPHPADPPQQLVDFVGAFTDPQASEVFRDAAVHVQNYVVQRGIAADNQAAADRLVSNLGVFKDGLASMAASDPAATFLGLDLVPGVVDGIVNTHPFLPDDQRQSAYETLTSDMQRDIARSGVLALADKNDTAARALLDHPKVTGLFDDRDRASLNGYIGAMATARDADSTALAQQRVVDAERTRAVSAINYFGALLDPNTFDVTFPPGWAQKVMSDPTLPPGDTASMLAIYDRLQKTGDVPLSDPLLMADFITAAANGRPIPVSGVLSQVGSNLRMDDALTLAGMGMPQTPAQQGEIKALATTLQTFRNQVMTPENGPAGVAAFERFVNFVVPEFRAGGSFNPKAENYILPSGDDNTAAWTFWNEFSPRGDDLVLNQNPAGIFRTMDPTQDRMPLDQIFGAPRRATAGDQVISPARPFSAPPPPKAKEPDMGSNPSNPAIDEDGPYYNTPRIKS